MTPPTNLPAPPQLSYGPYEYPHHQQQNPSPTPAPTSIYDYASLQSHRHQQHISPTTNSLLTPAESMPKVPRNSPFAHPTPHMEYRILPGRPMDVHSGTFNNNPNSNILPQNPNLIKTNSTPQPNTSLDFANHQPSTLRQTNNAHIPVSNTDIQQKQGPRLLSFVAAPTVEPPRRMPGAPPPRLCTKPREDPSSFVLVQYTSLSIAPDQGPPQVEAAARTLHAMGLAPPPRNTTRGTMSPSSSPDVHGPPHPPINALHNSSVPMSVPPHQRGNAPLLPLHGHISGSATAPVSSLPTRSVPMTSSAPGRYSMTPPIPPTYQNHYDPATPHDHVPRPSVPMKGVHRQEFASLPSDARNPTRQMFSQGMQGRGNRNQLQQTHLQQMHQMQQYRHRQPGQHFASEQVPSQGQNAQPFQQHMSYPMNQGSAQMSMRPPVQQHIQPKRGVALQQNNGTPTLQVNGYDKGMGSRAGASRIAPDRTATNKQARFRASGGHRSDASISMTPTTPATSATQPFPATPSSPDNNGSSSNGSTQREHACSYPGCNKTFDRRYNLTVHYRRHTDEMPYPCKVEGCEQKFKWRSSQSHHMKTRHQMGGVKVTAIRGAASRIGTGRGVVTRSNGVEPDGGGRATRAIRYPRAHSANEASGNVGHGMGAGGNGMVEVKGDDGEEGKEGRRAFSPKKRARTQRRNSTNR